MPVQNLIENMVSMLIHEQENDPVMQTTMGLFCVCIWPIIQIV